MPAKKKMVYKVSRKHGSMRGKGPRWEKIKRGMKKFGRFLHRSKIISRLGGVLGKMGVPYASDVSAISGAVGFGKHRRGKPRTRRIKRVGRPRRKRAGKGLSRSGGSLRRAGGQKAFGLKRAGSGKPRKKTSYP